MPPAHRTLLLVFLLVACGRDVPQLDPPGRNMLASIRRDALQPEQLIERLALSPDATVADIGAGPGFLTLPIARAVPRGNVIATDIRGDYLEYLAYAARQAGIANIETRLVGEEAPGLARASIDLALLCQVDHGLADRAQYLSVLKQALKPGGRIALVNYLRYREPDREAAERAGLHVVSEWQPSPPFFGMVIAP